MPADRGTHLAILHFDGPRFDEQPFEQLARGEARVGIGHAAHAVERPEQVHRRRPTPREILDDLLQPRIELPARGRSRRLTSHDGTVSRRHPNRRRTSHPQQLDRLPHRFDGGQVQFAVLDRQQSLVDKLQVPGLGIADPSHSGSRGHEQLLADE